MLGDYVVNPQWYDTDLQLLADDIIRKISLDSLSSVMDSHHGDTAAAARQLQLAGGTYATQFFDLKVRTANRRYRLQCL